MIGPDADYCKTTGDLHCHCLQALTEIERLKTAIATAQAELDIVERYFLGRVERATPGEEAHLHTVLNAPMKAIVKAQAALAEREADAELKPEEESRVQ